jgi:hypothetical protein
LQELEAGSGPGSRPVPPRAADQLTLFGPPEHPVLDELKELDVNALTPLRALALLAELSERARS